jgi:hypothetical protein
MEVESSKRKLEMKALKAILKNSIKEERVYSH